MMVVGWAWAGPRTSGAEEQMRAGVILVLSDDLGWADFSGTGG